MRRLLVCVLFRVSILCGIFADLSGLAAEKAPEAPKNLSTTWRYAEIPGFEILSNRPDTTTQQWVSGLQRQIQLFRHFFGDELLKPTDVPVQIILYSEETDALRGPAMPGRNAEPQPITHQGKIVGYNYGSDQRWGGNLKLVDVDVLMFSPNLRDAERMGRLGMSPTSGSTNGGVFQSYVTHLLQYRTPPLPSWLSFALHDLNEMASFGWNDLSWRDTSKQLAASIPFTPDLLMPMAEFLESESTTSIALAQGRLFLMWGIIADQGSHQAAFGKFIARTVREPITESLFQECFGLNYAELRERLAAQLELPRSRRPVELHVNVLPGPEPLPLRDATTAESARMTGEATRLYALHPMRPVPAGEAPDYYFAQAQQTLRRGYDAGDRDPRLLASLGLGECDAGQPEKGREFLEAAATAGVVRPRVYRELASLRFNEALAQPRGVNGKLAADQTAGVLAPLEVARRQTPSFPQTYGLIADTWLASATPPKEADLAALDEGLSRYPRDSDLASKTAQLYARIGLKPAAQAIIARALAFRPGAESATKLEQLSAALK